MLGEALRCCSTDRATSCRNSADMAYAAHHRLPSTSGTIAQLSVPAAGNYVINAKLVLPDDVNPPVGIACALVVGGDPLDQSATGLSGNTGDAVTDETA